MPDSLFAEWLTDHRQRLKATLDKIDRAQTRLAALHPDAHDIMRELEDAYCDQIGQHETYLWQMVRRHLPPEFAGLIDALDHHIADSWRDEEACCPGIALVQRPRFLLCIREDGQSVSINRSLIRTVEPHPTRADHSRVWFGPPDGTDYVDLAEHIDQMHDALVGWRGGKSAIGAAAN